MCGLAEAAVKLRILNGKLRRVGPGFLHLAANAPEVFDVARDPVFRCQPGVLHFQDRADLVQMLDADFLAARPQK